MRGWWRGFLGLEALFLVATPLLALAKGVPVTPGFLAFVGAFSLVPTGLHVTLGALPVRRFVRGLRDAGEEVRVVRDEMDWLGNRVLEARGPSGAWRVRTENGRYVYLDVLGPDDVRERRVRWRARSAGREAARRAQARRAGAPPAS